MDDPGFIALMKEYYTLQVLETMITTDYQWLSQSINIIKLIIIIAAITNDFKIKIKIITAGRSGWSPPKPLHWQHQGRQKPRLSEGETHCPLIHLFSYTGCPRKKCALEIFSILGQADWLLWKPLLIKPLLAATWNHFYVFLWTGENF